MGRVRTKEPKFYLETGSFEAVDTTTLTLATEGVTSLSRTASGIWEVVLEDNYESMTVQATVRDSTTSAVSTADVAPTASGGATVDFKLVDDLDSATAAEEDNVFIDFAIFGVGRY